jgi:hypothetical protein
MEDGHVTKSRLQTIQVNDRGVDVFGLNKVLSPAVPVVKVS